MFEDVAMLSEEKNTEGKTDGTPNDDIDKLCTPVNIDGDSQAQASEAVNTSPVVELGLITTHYDSPLHLDNHIL